MMNQRQALEVVAANRGQAIVIPTMGSIGIWSELSDSARDFHYMPSSMGQGLALGLGLALAQRTLRFVVLLGDGSLLMNLGGLVTMSNHPANLCVVLIDNALYEITGGQATAGAGRVDFAAMARSVGLANVFAFDELENWRTGANAALLADGPVFIWLKVQGETGRKTPSPPRPMAEQIRRLKGELGITEG